MIKKEINYLSLPDYFNKNLLINYNQKLNFNNSINLQFRLKQTSHLGSAIKAIYLLELIYPKKVQAIKLKIRLKKEFGSKTKATALFFFNLNLNGLELVDFYRFFITRPTKLHDIKTMEFFPIVNRKLKLFDYFNILKIVPKNINHSFKYLELNHLQ